jgi:murein DD-endopeptidase MepM/ murein hydrolase activator NlpD
MKTAKYFIQPMQFTGIPNTSSWAGYDYLQWTGDTYHPGLDYNYGAGEEDKGKPVLCIGNGFVEKCLKWDGVTKGFGNHVFIKHTLEDGSVWYSHYCHLNSITCSEGVDIDMGAEIGKCGGSGGWPSHLHLEIRKPIGKGYAFWPKPPTYTKEWIATNYTDPYGFIEKRKYAGTAPVDCDPNWRIERDTNWKLYFAEKEKVTELQTQLSQKDTQCKNKLIESINKIKVFLDTIG